MNELVLGGNGSQRVTVPIRTLNRHGLIAGATGTGKTVTLQVLVENLSAAGVPVFLADIKGDLSGLCCAGKPHKKIDERLQHMGVKDHSFKPAPSVFWDLAGKSGHPIRTTISEIGPLLFANLLELNETQTGVLYACFREADSNGMLMLDLDDLNSMLSWLSTNAKELKSEYGNISSSSIAAIKRRLMVLESQGLDSFLGEPAISLADLMQTDKKGHGIINIFDASKLVHTSPRLYSTLLIWLLSELFEELPELGDPDKPVFAIFLDEAHLLFDGAPKSLQDKIEQVVRLIRSKGVGVFFITQSPLDLPASVAGQLGLKIQHALRAFTPKDKKMIKAVAESFRPNPNFSTVDVLPQLGIGEALISALDEEGRPLPVEKTLLAPPSSRIGPANANERKTVIQNSPHFGRFEESINRESAHEILQKRAETLMKESEAVKKQPTKKKTRGRQRQSAGESFIKSLSRAVGSQLGRKIVRGLLGSLFKR